MWVWQRARVAERIEATRRAQLAPCGAIHQNQVAMLRAEADELRNLPVNYVARLIEAKRADQEQQRRKVAKRERQIRDPFEHDRCRSDPRRDGPTQGL